ncbi:MAG: hypothetical protein KatS3mg057_1001 [Herpetosiphonaceae bacterium]|nr:MAG: hypothetical protein KatS3mg057_1001 [Herpetosiphonaceae bacterium]
MRRMPLGIVIAFVLLLSGLISPTAPALAADELCFPETGQCISGRFREFWEQNGGLAVFGFPITPAREEYNADTGKTYLTQWFERNRFELHPENARPYDVLLGRLGNDRLLQQGRNWFDFPKADPATPHYFAETGHAIAEVFWGYWSSHGLEFDGQPGTSFNESLALFGLPLSEPAMETNSSGDTVLTQWFERARFEYHPNNPEPYKVLLGLLGNEVRANAGSGGGGGGTPDPCANVPDPVSASVWPDKCVEAGTVVLMDIYGFQPNENVGFWLTTPEGAIYGTVQTYNIGPTGAVEDFDFDTTGLDEGLWYWVFQGTSSGHQAIIYIYIKASSQPGLTCADVPEPVNARLRGEKCLQEGDPLIFDIYGFQPDEQVGFWLTDPYGDVVAGTYNTVSIGPTGRVNSLVFPTDGLYPGMWYWVFEGVSSGHKSIVYFFIEE